MDTTARASNSIERAKVRAELTKTVMTGIADLSKAVLANPAMAMSLGVAAIEYLAKAKAINETERGLLVATVISTAFLQSFTPVSITR